MTDYKYGLDMLFRYASQYRFEDFDTLFSALEKKLPKEELGEACLLRAQIKLLAADDSLSEDLNKADKLPVKSETLRPTLSWQPDSPNRFVVFSRKQGGLKRFLDELPRAEAVLGRCCGNSAVSLIRQISSEIFYYSGQFDEAAARAQKQCAADRNPSDRMLAHYVLFRCYLATGDTAKAGQCMLDMIALSQTYPECAAPYRIVRSWANLTTGWSGDTLRFQDVSPGKPLPVLEDRLAAIRTGIFQLSDSEKPFADYAARNYESACTMRRHFMDIFNALYWFQAGDFQQMTANFVNAYEASSASGLLMPFAEYGKQIVPMLKYIETSDIRCSSLWIDRVRSFANRYEESVETYRT